MTIQINSKYLQEPLDPETYARFCHDLKFATAIFEIEKIIKRLQFDDEWAKRAFELVMHRLRTSQQTDRDLYQHSKNGLYPPPNPDQE